MVGVRQYCTSVLCRRVTLSRRVRFKKPKYSSGTAIVLGLRLHRTQLQLGLGIMVMFTSFPGPIRSGWKYQKLHRGVVWTPCVNEKTENVIRQKTKTGVTSFNPTVASLPFGPFPNKKECCAVERPRYVRLPVWFFHGTKTCDTSPSNRHSRLDQEPCDTPYDAPKIEN